MMLPILGTSEIYANRIEAWAPGARGPSHASRFRMGGVASDHGKQGYGAWASYSALDHDYEEATWAGIASQATRKRASSGASERSK